MSARPRSVVLRAALAVTLVAGGITGLAMATQARQQPTFPHSTHEGLFPVCTGCHTGIPAGDTASYFPSPELCARCHDGQERPKVDWTAPTKRESNLLFQHPQHEQLLRQAGDDPVTCESCHSEAGRGRMAVDTHEELSTCFSCHAHQASEHFIDANCATCHEPLAKSGFGLAHIKNLPVPSDHQRSGFVLNVHGPEARGASDRCATCHTQEKCLTCHVDSNRRPIQAMPVAPEGMTLPDYVAHYPTPDSHRDEGWLSAHGQQARVGQCNTCHTQNDCTVCHVQPAPTVVAALPTRAETKAPGVELARRAPESHGSPFFLESHAGLASTDQTSCNTCHQQTFCTECHEAASGSGNVYHPPDFVSQHPAQAFGRTDDCTACHNTAVFCRNCHVQSGLGADGRLGPGYHTAEPLWLIRHGQAARQNLESCATCHKQRECTQCHGILGAFKVNPHGDDFNAVAAYERNPRTCYACHIKNPIEGIGS